MMQKAGIQYRLLLKLAGWFAIVLAVATTLTTSAVVFYSLLGFRLTIQRPSSPTAPTASASPPTVSSVAASGRLEPQGEVIHLSAPSSLELEKRVAQLLVKEGDRVRSGQVVAILDTFEQRLAALEQAQQQVEVAKAHLAQVKAGAKPGDIVAQKANVARIKSELGNAEIEYRRYQKLHQEGAISASQFDSKRLAFSTIQEQLNQAKATLDSIAEVRSVDMQAAKADVKSAIVAVKKAKADLELTYVRIPRNGQILKIYTQPGEVISNKGIATLGQTNQMYVVAEVYETDISKVRLGQRATITSNALTGQFKGTVAQIGWQIEKQDVLSADPVADVDARVVEVKIRLDPADSQQLAGLTNSKVEIVFDS